MLFGDVAQNPLDLWHETFVGHSVCFVKNNDLNFAEIGLTSFHQIDQSQWCGNDDFNTARKLLDLFFARRAAVNRHDLNAAMHSDRRQNIGDLHSEFASRHEYDATRFSWRGLLSNALDDRHTKGQSLARAGAGTTAEILTRQRNWNRLSLNRERSSEARRSQTSVNSRADAESEKACRGLHGRTRIRTRADISTGIFS